MKLWTHHPDHFQIDQPSIVIDPTKGDSWKDNGKDYRYRDTLPLLYERIGTNQFLWCCTGRGRYMPTREPSDRMEWELNLPLSQMWLISVPAWEAIVWNHGEDWESLFLDGLTEDEARNDQVDALVEVPLPLGSATRCGQLPPRYLASGASNPAYVSFRQMIRA